MPEVKKIVVKEELAALQKLHRKAAYHLKPRLKMLLVALGKDVHSKSALSRQLKVSATSVQEWKKRYEAGGLTALLLDERGGNRPSKIDAATDEALARKLSDAKDAPRSFTELQQWVEEHHLPGINYHTLNKYVKRKYGAKIKVVRKTHVQKDEEAVEQFKKKYKKK
jgi:transposase